MRQPENRTSRLQTSTHTLYLLAETIFFFSFFFLFTVSCEPTLPCRIFVPLSLQRVSFFLLVRKGIVGIAHQMLTVCDKVRPALLLFSFQRVCVCVCAQLNNVFAQQLSGNNNGQTWMHRKLSKKDSHKLMMTAGYKTTIMFCVCVEQENNTFEYYKQLLYTHLYSIQMCI